MADTDQDAGPTTQSTANAYLAAPPASLPGLSRPSTVPQLTPDVGPQQLEEVRDAPGYAALASGSYAPGQDLTKQNTELADNQQSVDLKKKDANDLVLNALRGPQQPSLYQRIGDDYQRTPAMQARQMAQTFANPLMLAALVTGALTRNPAMGAIKAMTGVMEGINEKDELKQKLNAQKAKAHIGDTELALEKETATISSIIDNKDLDPRDQLARLLPIAAADQNPGLLDAVKRGDFKTIHEIRDGYKGILGHIGDAKKKTEELTGEFAGMTKADKSRILRERKEGEEGLGQTGQRAKAAQRTGSEDEIQKLLERSGWDDATIDKAAQTYNETGIKPRYLGSRELAPIVSGRIEQRAGQLLDAAGKTTQDRDLDWQKYRTRQKVMDRFMATGNQNTRIVSLGTVVDHLATMQNLSDAWERGNIETFNRLAAEWARVHQNTAPTDMEAAAHIVGTEVIRSLGVAGAGTQEERNAAANRLSEARSPAVIRGVINNALRPLLTGQLESLHRAAVAGGLDEDMFYRMLGPQAKEFLQRQGTIDQTKRPKKFEPRRKRQDGNLFEEQPDGSWKYVPPEQ